MKQVRNFDKDNNMNLDYNYNYISNLEKSKQNYYNRKDNNNYYISDLERSKQNYYNLKKHYFKSALRTSSLYISSTVLSICLKHLSHSSSKILLVNSLTTSS